jgi:hypothetical protein
MVDERMKPIFSNVVQNSYRKLAKLSEEDKENGTQRLTPDQEKKFQTTRSELIDIIGKLKKIQKKTHREYVRLLDAEIMRRCAKQNASDGTQNCKSSKDLKS